MQIFLDSTNLEEIKLVKKIGLLAGLTTNPSLIALEKRRTNKKFKEIILDIASTIPDLPISVEVLKTDSVGMLEEARELSKWAKNIVIKIPCTKEALSVISTLVQEGIKTNATLCFSPLQAMLVAKVGATYVSPFIGRLDDISQEGMNLVADIKNIFWNYQLKTQILVASTRSPIHILNAARIGADCVTVPFAVIEKLMEHPLTTLGLEKFLLDAKNACQSDQDK